MNRPLHELAEHLGCTSAEIAGIVEDHDIPVLDGRADEMMVRAAYMGDWFRYDNLHRRGPYDWSPGSRGDRPWDQLDFHVDLGSGRIPKGRIGIDMRPSPGSTDLAIDLNRMEPSLPLDHYTPEQKDIIQWTEGVYHRYRSANVSEADISALGHGLPFPDNSIRSIITHHCLEHIGDGFEFLMEECYRVLEWGGIMRIIVPLFPSYTAISEYDHVRFFVEGSFEAFCGVPNGPVYTDGFSEPYNTCRFRQIDEDMSPPTPPQDLWVRGRCARETRVTLWKHRGDEPTIPNAEEYL